MGGNSADKKAIADDLRQNAIEDENRRRRQIEAFQAIEDRQKNASAEIRLKQMESVVAIQKQQDEARNRMLEQNQKILTESRTREDSIRAQQEQNERDTISHENDLIDRQRTVNLSEITKRFTNHQNLMTREQGRLAETEIRNEKNLVDMKNQLAETQDNLNEDKKAYHEEKIQKSAENASQLEVLVSETNELIIQKDKNVLLQKETLMRIEKNAIENKGKVLIARGDDDNEQNFIDAVNSIRQKGYAVSDIISRLGEHAYCLHKGHSVHSVKNDVFKCSKALGQAKLKLGQLRDDVNHLLGHQESRNSGVPVCHDAARQIEEAIKELETSLNKFKGSLNGKNSIELYENVLEKNKNLTGKIHGLPSLVKSNYTLNAIQNGFQSICAVNGNHVASLEQTTTLALQEKKHGNRETSEHCPDDPKN